MVVGPWIYISPAYPLPMKFRNRLLGLSSNNNRLLSLIWQRYDVSKYIGTPPYLFLGSLQIY